MGNIFNNVRREGNGFCLCQTVHTAEDKFVEQTPKQNFMQIHSQKEILSQFIIHTKTSTF